MEFQESDRMRRVRGSAIREILKVSGKPGVISLAGGNPAPELFPNEELAAIAADLLKNQPVLSLQYGVTEGYTPLREAIRERLQKVEGIQCPEDDILVVSGAQQGIDLCAKVLLNEGDVVIVEEPSFVGALNAFRAYNAQLAGVKMDADGMNLTDLERVIAENPRAKMIYAIPSFQNPMGCTMPLEKRRALYALAKAHHLFILEDNPYGDLTFTGQKTPTLKSMDTEGLVLYSGSFSKILAPGLRIGFLCAPRALAQRVVVAKQAADVHTAMLPQLLAYEFMRRFDLDALIEKMRLNYAHKCGVMLDAIARYFPKDIFYTRPGGGLFIWCDLGHGVDTLPLSQLCAEKKVVYVPGNTFMTDPDKPSSALRLNYSTMDDARIQEGIERLGQVFCEALR